jgi:hypothetical protein
VGKGEMGINQNMHMLSSACSGAKSWLWHDYRNIGLINMLFWEGSLASAS